MIVLNEDPQINSALVWWRQLSQVQKDGWARYYYKIADASTLSDLQIVDLYWAIAE